MQPQTITKHPRRREGNIPKLKGNLRPTEFLFFDTETYIVDGKNNTVQWPLRLGVAIYVKLNKDLTINKRLVLSFKTVDDFITILKTYCKAQRKIYVFAHNIKFDIMVLNLPMELDKHGIHSNLPVISERLFIWNVPVNKAHALFLDTANYGVISVEQLGKDLGYPKQKVDFTNVSDDILRAYCRVDVEIIEKFILEYVRFIDTNGLGSFKTTLASQSMTAWRSGFMRKTCCLHKDEKVLELERKAYHGGRVECFKIGVLPEENYYYLDVNSMYSYCMKNSNVPTKLMYSVDSCTVEKLAKYVLAHYVIADVMVSTDILAYPVLKDGKLLFPRGTYRTTLHHKELTYALAHNHIKTVFSVALYKFAKIFNEYVDFFYKVKTDSKLSDNYSWYIIAKLLQNSLYGKLAQTGIHQEITYGEYEQKIERFYGNKLDTDEYETAINWLGTRVKEKKQGESSFSFPAAAGAITANARMLLLSYIEKANWHNVVYCDTDSLIVNNAGYNSLIHYIDDKELGALKVEQQSYYVHIHGPKDYEFGAISRHKGISAKAIQTNANNWRVLQFGGIKPWFNAGTNLLANGRYIDKKRLLSYTKGYADYSTGIVTPFTFDEMVDAS